jgi:hypothetical protein
MVCNIPCVDTLIGRLQQKLNSCNAKPDRRYDLSLSVEIVPVDVTHPTDLERLLSQAGDLLREKEKHKAVRAKSSNLAVSGS